MLICMIQTDRHGLIHTEIALYALMDMSWLGHRDMVDIHTGCMHTWTQQAHTEMDWHT